MAFPAVVSRTTTDGLSQTTNPVINIGSPANGTRVVINLRITVGTTGVSWPAGWTEIVEDSSDASDDASAIAYRDCDGTEGATITLTTSTTRYAAIAYQITGFDPAIAPEVSAVAVGTSTTPDPASLTPTGGAKDYLWLWLGGWEGEQTSPPTGSPTNYTDPVGASSGTAGGVANNGQVGGAERQLNAASEDPPSWTISTSEDWTAWTVAIHPVSATPRRYQLAWAELEVPSASRRYLLGWAELEVPNAPRRYQLAWAELETGDAPPRRYQLAWAELEVPETLKRYLLAWAEFQVPDAPKRYQLAWAEFETPDTPKWYQLAWAEFEVPNTPKRYQLSWAELELADFVRRYQLSHAYVEFPNAPGVTEPVYAWRGLPRIG